MNFLQDKEWGAFQKSLGREVLHFDVCDRDRTSRLTAQGILNSAGPGNRYLFVPYGPVLGADGEGSFPEAMNMFADEASREISNLAFIRIEPEFEIGENMRTKNLRKSIDLDPHKTLILDLGKSEEQLLADMHPKTRYNIKVAQKRGVYVHSQTEMQGCGILFLETARRAGIRAFNLEYYEELLKHFCNGNTIKARLYTAWHENDLLAVNLMIYFKDTVTYLFGGSADIKRNFMAPYLLHWEAIKFAKADGYKKYDFWGIEEDSKHPWYGFSRFKLGFGGEVKHYGGTWDYVLKPSWYRLYTLARAFNRRIRK